jgi:O-antigen/teichoic acid export membrane protein
MSIAVLAVLYERLGVIFLRVFQADDAVGYFSSADRLIVPFITVFAVFNGAVFPALARLSTALSVLTFAAAAVVTGAIRNHDVSFLLRIAIANDDRAPEPD